MAIIDFKEIPRANVADGNQDIFELFAREFFYVLGFPSLKTLIEGKTGEEILLYLKSGQESLMIL